MYYLGLRLTQILITLSLTTSLMTSLVSCAIYDPTSSTENHTKECSVPTDQSGTISGHWPASPIPVAFQQGAFQDAEITEITTAADSWNSFFKFSKTTAILNTTSGDSLALSSATNPTTSAGGLCSQGIIQGSAFSGRVVVYKLTRWPYTSQKNAIALTSFCTQPQNPYPKMFMAAIEINYENFFVQGKKQPDLQSILLHELGHLIGLNHSCEASAKKGVPSCNGAGLNPDYVRASMFPVFSFTETGIGQTKRSLGVNDESRANCLY